MVARPRDQAQIRHPPHRRRAVQFDPRAELALEDEHVAVEAEDEIAREEEQARRRLEPRDLRKRALDLGQFAVLGLSGRMSPPVDAVAAHPHEGVGDGIIRGRR
jgi:hypothetical protein